jgi:hypothetical protein
MLGGLEYGVQSAGHPLGHFGQLEYWNFGGTLVMGWQGDGVTAAVRMYDIHGKCGF